VVSNHHGATLLWLVVAGAALAAPTVPPTPLGSWTGLNGPSMWRWTPQERSLSPTPGTTVSGSTAPSPTVLYWRPGLSTVDVHGVHDEELWLAAQPGHGLGWQLYVLHTSPTTGVQG